MLDRCNQEIFQVVDTPCETTRHKGTVMHNGDGRHVKGFKLHPFDLKGALFSLGGRGKCLTLRERINLVVMDHHRDIRVSSKGMQKMIPPFSVAVPVPGNNECGQIRIGALNADSHRYGADREVR